MASLTENVISDDAGKHSATLVVEENDIPIEIVHEIVSLQQNAANSREDNGLSTPQDLSLSSIVNAAHSIKETVQQTLKCRESQECALNEGIEKKLADLELVIKSSSELAAPLPADSQSSTGITCLDVTDGTVESDLMEVNKDGTCEFVSQDDTNLEENVSVDSTSLQAVNDISEEVNLTVKEQDLGKVSTSNSKSGSAGNKRKGEKTADQLLKSLSAYSSLEEKLQVMCKRHADLLEEQRACESKQRLSERLAVQVAREKEVLQAEHNRTVLARSRLESLSRELQRQNKAMKEESLLRIREEEEKRKDIASKFQTTLNDITTLMQDNQQRNTQLREENSELAQKLKSLVDNYETWEKHMEKVVRQKELETQLTKAKLNKVHLHMREEQEKFLKEKKQLLENINTLQLKSTELIKNELQLRTELSLYNSKYEEFQGILTKSNQVFSSFKVDMDKMSKKIKTLEKETSQWKSKWENSNRALLAMAADKQKRDQDLLASQQRVSTLEKLCRALQTERVEFQNLLKQNASSSKSLQERNTHSSDNLAPVSSVQNGVSNAVQNAE